MTEVFSGSYPIESRGGEIERLHIQSAAMVPDTERMLELIGVREGWSCLDIGCGPGGIVGLLSKRVGSTGRVVGLDMNTGFLEHARATAPSNVEFVLADAYGSNLPAGTFDLVHMRFVASTSGAPERLLQEAKRLARPGGTIALQEADIATLNCYPSHPSWDKLKAALFGAFSGVGADVEQIPVVFQEELGGGFWGVAVQSKALSLAASLKLQASSNLKARSSGHWGNFMISWSIWRARVSSALAGGFAERR